MLALAIALLQVRTLRQKEEPLGGLGLNWLVDPVDAVAAAEQQVHHSAPKESNNDGFNHPDFDDDNNNGGNGGGGASPSGGNGGGSPSKRANGNGGAPRGQFRPSPQPQQKAPPKQPARLPVPGVGVAQRMSTQAVQDAYNARAILDLPAYGQQEGDPYGGGGGYGEGQDSNNDFNGRGMPSPLHSKQPPNPDSIRATVTDNTAELDLTFPTLEFRRCVGIESFHVDFNSADLINVFLC